MAFFSIATLCVFLITTLRRADNSLLSRVRNPNEYVARPEKIFMPDEINDEMYNDLILEVPKLKEYLHQKGRRNSSQKLPYLKNPKPEETYYPQEYDFYKPDAEEESIENGTVVPAKMPFLSVSAVTNNTNQTGRRWWSPYFHFYGTYMAHCYSCGLNASRIPLSPLCHDAFESQGWRARTMARFFRTKCYRNTEYWAQRIKDHWFEGWHYELDHGLITEQYGQYIGGCFKRFMDVGTVYTQRGCRAWWPRYTDYSNFATHRFRRLEALLKNKKNACIVSPHASLTPFARSISLFVRYHVCVCEGRYCNNSFAARVSVFLLLFLLYLVL